MGFNENRQFLAQAALGIGRDVTPVGPLVINQSQANALAGYTEALIPVNANFYNWYYAGATSGLLIAAGTSYTYPTVANLNLSGQALYFAIDGSSAPVRLNLTIGGRLIKNFAPGQILRTPFSSVQVAQSPESCARGYARLLAIQDPASFEEKILQQDAECGRYRSVFIRQGTDDNTFRINAPTANIAYGSTPNSLNLYSDMAVLSTERRVADVKGWHHVRIGIWPGGTYPTAMTVIPWFCWVQSISGGTALQWYQQLQAAQSVSYSGAAMGNQLFTFDLNRCYQELDPNTDQRGCPVFFFPEVRDATGGTVGYDYAMEGLS
jgi:hypothetical protein